jgi:hypothetical protein
MGLDAQRIALELGTRDVQILDLQGQLAEASQRLLAAQGNIDRKAMAIQGLHSHGRLVDATFQDLGTAKEQVVHDVEHVMFPREQWVAFCGKLDDLLVALDCRESVDVDQA